MKKISTLFKKDINNLARVINEIDAENKWVFDGKAIATRKFDGSACAVINGKLYKRYDAKRGKIAPEDAIPCQDADFVTGHHPHWVACEITKKEDKYFWEGFYALAELGKVEDGTYELVGEKIQGNPENINGHLLVKHGTHILSLESLDFEFIKNFLSNPENNMEGIVFHHTADNRMCKIRKSDFGVRRKLVKELIF
ncbi:hypothetical protein AB670_03206 [Chryseobacterium sp. MOF25P]|uniref:RNA ligase 1 family protein n=1 Tax=unclassified Chryseobacterium TaxID=2593645 RepID=UPI0008053B9D|nr:MULTISPECIES: DUF5565 family protein [unclassified Chryseobacterium]OBW40442.1 hypothetical protein AB670_03206 [Chryseobacterium sp. MOF25P]OBW46167.1 hypothetical protein AB671_01816 [Chryseobacterium sp. BGARF1]